MMKYTIIINPVAGNGLARKKGQKLIQLFQAAHLPYHSAISQRPGQIKSLSKQLANQADSNGCLIIVGGDGSFNEAVTGVKNSQQPELPLAFLPAGTGNDFARAAHLTADPQQFFDSLATAQAKQVNCGYYEIQNNQEQSGYFVNNVGIGFDAFIVHHANHSKLKSYLNKLSLGQLIYAANIIRALCQQQAFDLAVKTKSGWQQYHHLYFVTTTNHPYFGGGFAIQPSASIHDNLLSLVLVDKIKVSQFIRLLIKLVHDGSHVKNPHFHLLQGNEFKLDLNTPEYVQIDGEDQRLARVRFHFKLSNFYLCQTLTAK
jgi:YegS/Rv2252/BmrU family lipid kinase